MSHQLPALPYANNALEPHIDEQTMMIHHDRHHNTYVTNLNAALESAPQLQGKSVEQLISDLTMFQRLFVLLFATMVEVMQTTACSGKRLVRMPVENLQELLQPQSIMS